MKQKMTGAKTPRKRLQKPKIEDVGSMKKSVGAKSPNDSIVDSILFFLAFFFFGAFLFHFLVFSIFEGMKNGRIPATQSASEYQAEEGLHGAAPEVFVPAKERGITGGAGVTSDQ